jgi:hypothetical protein
MPKIQLSRTIRSPRDRLQLARRQMLKECNALCRISEEDISRGFGRICIDCSSELLLVCGQAFLGPVDHQLSEMQSSELFTVSRLG